MHAGKPLAGDFGAILEVIRTFHSGWQFGIWNTWADYNAIADHSAERRLLLSAPLSKLYNWGTYCPNKIFIKNNLPTFHIRADSSVNSLNGYNRKGLAIDMDISMPSSLVIRSVKQVIEQRGDASAFRCDNEPEYISNELVTWTKNHPASPHEMLIQSDFIALYDMGGGTFDV